MKNERYYSAKYFAREFSDRIFPTFLPARGLGNIFSQGLRTPRRILVRFRLLRIQWKQDMTEGSKMISRAIQIDNKCEFAYETLGTFEVQK